MPEARIGTDTDFAEFSTDGTFAGNSDDAIPTEKAIKTYVDALPSPAFSTTSNVTSNSAGDLTTDDFVFGSPQLDDDGDTDHDSKFFFDTLCYQSNIFHPMLHNSYRHILDIFPVLPPENENSRGVRQIPETHSSQPRDPRNFLTRNRGREARLTPEYGREVPEHRGKMSYPCPGARERGKIFSVAMPEAQISQALRFSGRLILPLASRPGRG